MQTVNPYMHACRVYLCLLVSRQHGIEREDKEGEVDHILQRVKVKSQTQTPYQCTHHHKMPHTNTLVWPGRPNFHFGGWEVAGIGRNGKLGLAGLTTHTYTMTPELKQNTQ